MRYKLVIKQWLCDVDTYECEDAKSAVEWFRAEWLGAYDCGYCSLCVYDDGRELSLDEELDLGFCDD